MRKIKIKELMQHYEFNYSKCFLLTRHALIVFPYQHIKVMLKKHSNEREKGIAAYILIQVSIYLVEKRQHIALFGYYMLLRFFWSCIATFSSLMSYSLENFFDEWTKEIISRNSLFSSSFRNKFRVNKFFCKHSMYIMNHLHSKRKTGHISWNGQVCVRFLSLRFCKVSS